MLPTGWRQTNLKSILADNIKNGYSPNAATHTTGYWVLGLGALTDDRLNQTAIKPVEPTSKVLDNILKSGDFLISRSNTPDKVGRSIQFKGEIENCSYPDLIMRFRVDNGIAVHSFIEFKLQSYDVRSYYKKSAAGSSKSMVKINKSTVENTPLLLPPLPEQKKIATILATWDKAIATTAQLLEKSEWQKKALMQKLLTGHEKTLKTSAKWQDKFLSEIADVIVSPVDKKSKPDEIAVELCNYTDVYYNNKITRQLTFMKATAKKAQIDKYTLQLDDVVITKDSETPGDIAVPAHVSEDLQGVLCGYHLAIVRPKKNIADGAFLSYLFSAAETRYYFFTLATGATRFGLSIGGIAKAHFLLPPLCEQQKIAEILTCADNEITSLKQKLDYFKQEKQALMQQLLTGKRRVKLD